MEEFEDLVPQPDAEGRMELTYRAWTEVDDVIWTMGRTMIFLDLSFNSIVNLPHELGDLYQLKELNVSCNKLVALPPSVGKLIKLKTIKANGNKIQYLPETIGKCRSLQELILSENLLVAIPKELADCPRLEVLLLQNNRLKQLPNELGLLKGILKSVDVANNADLDMIPKEMRSNTTIVMWIVGLHLASAQKVKVIENATELMRRAADASLEQLSDVKQEIKLELKKENDLLIERASLNVYLGGIEALEQAKEKTGCIIS
jgi:hypothetical protein